MVSVTSWIIAPKTINPADHEDVAFPQNIEQPFSLGPFPKPCGDARDAMVRQHQVGLEPGLFGLHPLMLKRLVEGRDPAIQTVFIFLFRPVRRGVVRSGSCPQGQTRP